MHDSPHHSSYGAALNFLLSRIDYERAVAVPYLSREFRLDRMHELLVRLGNPHQALKVVHVAGTKGKGSTAAMTAAILTAAGYRTGLYTSPHLDRVEERLVIDGRSCSADQFVALLDRVRPVVEAMDREARGRGSEIGEPAGVSPRRSEVGVRKSDVGGQGSGAPQVAGGKQNPRHPSHVRTPNDTDGVVGPTYFEITTAMAFLLFADERTDVAVVEVGLGGRLDSTNVIRPLVSVITSISFDHMKQLGTSLDAIAREKAGIIKPGVPIVSGVLDEEARRAIEDVRQERGSTIYQLDADFAFTYRPPHQLENMAAAGEIDFHLHRPGGNDHYNNLQMALLGRHQASNAAVALATIAELRRQGWNVPESAIRRGLAETRCPARVEVVSRRPAIVIDTAHNLASVRSLVETLEESFSAERRLLLFAATQEKQVREMLETLLPRFDRVILTRYWNNPRGLPLEHLAAIAREISSVPQEVFPTPSEAWRRIRQLTTPEHLVCVTGSFFLAAEIRGEIGAENGSLALGS